jgi:AcrR family transcriptional regulator
MARPRVIDREAVLEAAEIVVGRDGAANLTLDAVAAEAGISKASVIYDYGSKQSLIRAVIERRIRLDSEKIQAALDQLGDVPSARIRGRIKAAAHFDDNPAEAVALNLCSALAQDAELRSSMRTLCSEEIEAIRRDAENPGNATVAFLAVEGLKIMEYFGFLRLTSEGRAAVLTDIAALVEPSAKTEASS